MTQGYSRGEKVSLDSIPGYVGNVQNKFLTEEATFWALKWTLTQLFTFIAVMR